MGSSRTVVVHATVGGADLERTLRRLARSEPRTTDVVVVTHQSLRLPGPLARRARVERERTPEATARRVEELAAAGAMVLRGSGSTGRPTVGACLIVKDEEAVISACVDAVAPFVDEVVVYDTGSSDRTVAAARAAGATVVEGFWDDSFGGARNRAMEHCTAQWLLFVDADEVVTGDPARLHEQLGVERADVLSVTIVSTSWGGGTEGDEIYIRRLARRTRVRWEGRLHEYLVAAPGVTDLTASTRDTGLRLLHSGYQGVVMDEKSKSRRNLEISRAALDALPADDPGRTLATANHGRSLLLAGRHDEGLAALETVRASGGHPSVVVGAGRAAMTALVSARRLDEARTWLDVLAEHGESRGNLVLRRADIAMADGDPETAEAALAELPLGPAAAADRDPWGAPFDPDGAASSRVVADLALGRPADALAVLLELLGRRSERVGVAQLVAAVEQTSTPWTSVLADAPGAFLDRSVREVMSMEPDAGLRWCAAFVEAHPGDHRPLVAGCLLAARGDLTTALTWSVTAREAGQPQLCPVRAGAEQEGRPAHERALLWALLADAFGEFDALARYHETLAQVSPVDLRPLQETVASLAPSLAGSTAGAR